MSSAKARLLLAALGAAAVASLVLLACGGNGSSSTAVVTELRRVVGVKQGQPILVFVYTDG